MSNLQVTLPDGSVKSVPPGSAPIDVAREISTRLADDAIVAKVNGEVSIGQARATTTAQARIRGREDAAIEINDDGVQRVALHEGLVTLDECTHGKNGCGRATAIDP